ncbi:MAG: dihydroneopterin aldolase [Stellaceae bacterium]
MGVFRHERGARQRVRINLDLAVREECVPVGDDLRNVVCYHEIVSGNLNLWRPWPSGSPRCASPMPVSASPACGSRSSTSIPTSPASASR